MNPRHGCIALLVLVQASAVHGFKAKEHRALSNDALRLAYAHYLTLGYPADPKMDEIVKSLEPGGSQVDYGELVRLVDHLVDPLKALERKGYLEIYPCKASDLDSDLLKRVLPESLAELRALTVNDNHFGAELMLNLRFWHQAATSMAATGSTPYYGEPCGASKDGNLFAALVLNALADHFLEDFFAPGHIYTPRFGLHDAVAGAMHDQYNILGTKFLVDQEKWKELQTLLGSLPPDLSSQLDLTEADLQELRTQGLTAIELRGDGDLDRERFQRLFITLVVARSILDVLESYGQERQMDSFASGLHWEPLKKTGKNPAVGWSHSQGKIPYGIHAIPWEYQGTIRFPMVFWLSVGNEMLTSDGEASSRGVIEIDSLAAWMSPFRASKNGQVRLRSWQVGASTGYSYAWNQHETADGPRAALILAYPMIHSQFLIEGTYLHYEDGRTHKRDLGYGVGFQTGFSLMTLDVRVGKGYRFDDSGALQDTWAIRSGLSFAFPLLRIPLLGRIERAALERYRRNAMKGPVDTEPPAYLLVPRALGSMAR